MPEGVDDSTECLNSQRSGIIIATVLMPFAGIGVLWFIGVVRDGFGRYEDRFFASVLRGLVARARVRRRRKLFVQRRFG